MYYYELHEGDDDLFSDLLLAREEEMDPDEFFELVQSIRRQIQDRYEDDSLIEAIAAELEREHGFRALFDSRLTASVHVSTVEAENFLTALDDEDDEDETDGADYRAILADFDPDDLGPTH
ncbi:MAG TPA: hypothetical protein VFI28_12490 [Candidatus Limnocylindrales bacterium]|nr:hypothetical protein [Candidatus Limnocylindrales bacterium]